MCQIFTYSLSRISVSFLCVASIWSTIRKQCRNDTENESYGLFDYWYTCDRFLVFTTTHPRLLQTRGPNPRDEPLGESLILPHASPNSVQKKSSEDNAGLQRLTQDLFGHLYCLSDPAWNLIPDQRLEISQQLIIEVFFLQKKG